METAATAATTTGGAFWHGRTVFLTGHTGFKGSWLALWLQARGAEVVGYALAPPTQPNLFELAEVGAGMTSLHGDVRDAERLRDAVAEHRPEVVLHLAAQPLVRRAYRDPVATYATNVMGTVHALEAARHAGSVRAFVAVTSDKCYENRGWPWGYRERDPMGGHDPYSSSKGCTELALNSWRRSFFSGGGGDGGGGLVLASARAGNVIGGGDWAEDRLLPDVVRAFMDGRPARIRSPRAVRPWQHVLEPLGGYLRLAERLAQKGGAYAGGWNFGPRDEDARPVSWVVKRMAERWGRGARWDSDDDANHPHEAHHLKLDCSKARARLGWAPRIGLATALDWTVAWYRCYHERPGCLPAFTREQVAQYERLSTPVALPHKV